MARALADAIGALATQHNADFVLVAGDVFESNQLQRVTVANGVDVNVK